MDVNEAVSLYCSKSEAEQVKFLSRLSHQITIFARDTYEFESDSLSDPIKLRSINEMMHRILGQQFDLLLSNTSRYPDGTFIEILFEMAAACHFESHLCSGMIDSFKLCADTTSP